MAVTSTMIPAPGMSMPITVRHSGADGAKVAGQVQVAGRGSSWAYPTVVGGRLYLRYDTNLYCYDVQAR